MRNNKLFSFLAVALLFSCGGKAYAKETIASIVPLNAVPVTAFTETNFAQQRALRRLEMPFGPNEVYSPLSAGLTDLVEEERLSEYASYVKEALNVQVSPAFSISAKAVVASTKEIDENRRKLLSDSGVDAFVGSVPELEASLSDHFGQNVQLFGNEGTYVLANLDVEDRFLIPLTVKTKAFNGAEGHDFTEQIVYGKVARLNRAILCEVEIRMTSMRFLLPDDGAIASEIDPKALIETTQWEQKRIALSCPEFSLRSRSYQTEKDHLKAQDCAFEYNRYGIKGHAFTISGPTSADPGYDIAIDLNRSFYFASMYRNLPAFVGLVSSL